MFPERHRKHKFHAVLPGRGQRRAAALGTVPVLGWVSNNTQFACGFPESQFPGQQSYSPANCGNGIYPQGVNGCTTSGGCDLFGNSTTQAYTSVSEPAPEHFDCSGTWISHEHLGRQHMVGQLGELPGNESKLWQRRQRQGRGHVGSGQRADVVGRRASRRASSRIHIRRGDQQRHWHGVGHQDRRSDGSGQRPGDRLLGSVLLLEERH